MGSRVARSSPLWAGCLSDAAKPVNLTRDDLMSNEMTELKIIGMTCASCVVHVKEALEKIPGVHRADVSYASGKAELKVDEGASREQMQAAVEALG